MAISIEVTKREKGTNDGLRAAGKLPAVLYGPEMESTPIALDHRQFERLWREAGESTVITLTGLDKDHDALIHDIDIHPVTGTIRHADFYVFRAGETITVDVPLEFVGSAPAEKSLGGTLIKVMHELEVEVLPKDLPHEIVVDVSAIVDFDSVIHVSDLDLPAGVTPTADPNDVVVSAARPKTDEEMEAESETDDADIASVEVEGEKEDKEGDEGEGDSEKKED